MSRVVSFRDLLDEWEQDAIDAHEAFTTGQPRGPVTGFPTLDEHLGGWLPVGFNVLHAAPGAGKTAWALQVAADCGAPALYVTAEMAVLELMRRHTARVTRTYLGKFKRGLIPPAQSVELARKAIEAAPYLSILDCTTVPLTPEELATEAAQVKGTFRDLLVVVDSIHAWAPGWCADDSEYEYLASAVGALRQIGTVLRCTVLGIAERNRAARKTGGQDASAGHRIFEYSAESVLELNREMTKNADTGQMEEVMPDANGDVNVTLRISKSRHGAQGHKVNLRFNGGFQSWGEA